MFASSTCGAAVLLGRAGVLSECGPWGERRDEGVRLAGARVGRFWVMSWDLAQRVITRIWNSRIDLVGRV